MDNSFLKWAGGKNWFVRNYSQLLPQEYNRYVDPFLGGGSVFFFLEPQTALLSDINDELVTTFRAVRDEWQRVEDRLRFHANHHNEEYYYFVRAQRPRTIANIAARMIYLNRTCFNGIYRVNRRGQFNVPRGSGNTVLLPTDQFARRSELLHNAIIRSSDFEETIDESEEGDFLFCDPPYAVLDEQRFVGYTGELFNWNDQLRLANAIERARMRGVMIVLTNVNHPAVRALYDERVYDLIEAQRYCSISGDREGRQQYSEIIVSANIQH